MRGSPPRTTVPRAAPALVEDAPATEAEAERRILAQRRRNRLSGAPGPRCPSGRSQAPAEAGASEDAPGESAAERAQRAARAKARREAKKEAGEAAQETLVTVAAESNVRANRVCI